MTPFSQNQLPGILPIGRIEPFNNVQKQALTALANLNQQQGYYPNMRNKLFSKYTDGIQDTQQYFGQGKNLYNLAISSMQPYKEDSGVDIVQNNVQKFMNPFIANVIDQHSRDVQSTLQYMQSNIKEQASAMGAFGGTRQAILEANANDNALKQISDMSGKVRMQAYDNASNKAIDNYKDSMDRKAHVVNTEIGVGDRLMQQANTQLQHLGSLLEKANQFQGDELSRQLQQESARLNAGDRIQDQNQQFLNLVQQVKQDEANSGLEKLRTLAGLLGQFPSQGATPGVHQEPSTLQSILQGILSGARMGNAIF